MPEQPRAARRTQNRVVGLFRDTLGDRDSEQAMTLARLTAGRN